MWQNSASHRHISSILQRLFRLSARLQFWSALRQLTQLLTHALMGFVGGLKPTPTAPETHPTHSTI